jgi:hypothetical protein
METIAQGKRRKKLMDSFEKDEEFLNEKSNYLKKPPDKPPYKS